MTPGPGHNDGFVAAIIPVSGGLGNESLVVWTLPGRFTASMTRSNGGGLRWLCTREIARTTLLFPVKYAGP